MHIQSSAFLCCMIIYISLIYVHHDEMSVPLQCRKLLRLKNKNDEKVCQNVGLVVCAKCIEFHDVLNIIVTFMCIYL